MEGSWLIRWKTPNQRNFPENWIRFLKLFSYLGRRSIVVEHSTHNPKIEGSITASYTGQRSYRLILFLRWGENRAKIESFKDAKCFILFFKMRGFHHCVSKSLLKYKYSFDKLQKLVINLIHYRTFSSPDIYQGLPMNVFNNVKCQCS